MHGYNASTAGRNTGVAWTARCKRGSRVCQRVPYVPAGVACPDLALPLLLTSNGWECMCRIPERHPTYRSCRWERRRQSASAWVKEVKCFAPRTCPGGLHPLQVGTFRWIARQEESIFSLGEGSLKKRLPCDQGPDSVQSPAARWQQMVLMLRTACRWRMLQHLSVG